MDLGTDIDLQSYEDEQLVVRMTEVAAAERQQAVQMMLSKQLDKGGSLEEQIQRQKSFTRGSTVKTISDHTKGQLSLRDFVSVQEEHKAVDDLRDCGLTDQEIAFKLQQEGRTSTILQPAKRGSLSVDPAVQSKRLKAVNNQISQQQPSSSYRPDPSDENPSVNQPYQPRKGIFSQLSLSRKFTHPDDPINHLHLLEAELFSKTSDEDPPVYQGCDPKPSDREEEGQDKGCLLDNYRSNPWIQVTSLTEEKNSRLSGSKKTSVILPGRDSDEDTLYCHKSLVSDKNVLCVGDQTSGEPSTSTSPARHGCTDVDNQSTSTLQCNDVAHECLTSTKSEGKCTHKCTCEYTQHATCEETLETNQEQANTQRSVRRLYGRVSAISTEDIKRNRLTEDEIRQLDRFKNYSPGTPSKVLYLKNLSKHVCEEDLVSLFIHFQNSEKPQLVFKLLTGRMRGQAFVTFPDVETASSAIDLVNGYNLKGKPVIIQYGRQQQK